MFGDALKYFTTTHLVNMTVKRFYVVTSKLRTYLLYPIIILSKNYSVCYQKIMYKELNSMEISIIMIRLLL